MAKFYGPIGYSETVETKPGVWKDQIIERNYTCEVIRNNTKWTESSDSTNDNLNVNHQFSILADPFFFSNSGSLFKLPIPKIISCGTVNVKFFIFSAPFLKKGRNCSFTVSPLRFTQTAYTLTPFFVKLFPFILFLFLLDLFSHTIAKSSQ